MFFLSLLLALAWAFLTGEFTFLNFFFGFFLSGFILWLLAAAQHEAKEYTRRMIQVPVFVIFFLYKVTKANIRVAIEVLTIKHNMTPGIVAVPLDIKGDVGVTMLANLITLTPGTLSLDVSEDYSVLYVHSMYIDELEQSRKEIKNEFEIRLREIME